jgi:hypothetical protein
LTPLRPPTAFSTLALQAAQDIPLILNRFKLSPHKLFKGFDKLVDGFGFALFNVGRDAGFYMSGKQFFIKGIKGGGNGRYLHYNIGTVGIFIHHSLYSPYLPFYSGKSVKQSLLLGFGSLFGFMTTIFHRFFSF